MRIITALLAPIAPEIEVLRGILNPPSLAGKACFYSCALLLVSYVVFWRGGDILAALFAGVGRFDIAAHFW